MLNEEKSVGNRSFFLSPASAHGRSPILGSTSVHHASFYRGQAVGHRGNPALSPRQLHFSLDRSLPHSSSNILFPLFLSFTYFPFPPPFLSLCPSSPFISHPPMVLQFYTLYPVYKAARVPPEHDSSCDSFALYFRGRKNHFSPTVHYLNERSTKRMGGREPEKGMGGTPRS